MSNAKGSSLFCINLQNEISHNIKFDCIHHYGDIWVANLHTWEHTGAMFNYYLYIGLNSNRLHIYFYVYNQ